MKVESETVNKPSVQAKTKIAKAPSVSRFAKIKAVLQKSVGEGKI